MATVLPGTSRYLCPLRCGWYHDVPPPGVALAGLLPVPPEVTDLGGAIEHIATEAATRTARATEAVLVAHLDTHTMPQVVAALERLHAEIRQLTAPAPPAPEENRPMTETLDATVRTIVETMPFAHADVQAAIDALRAYPDNESPSFAPWTDEQLTSGLPSLAAMAVRGPRSLPDVAWAVRRTAGVEWTTPAAPSDPRSGT